MTPRQWLLLGIAFIAFDVMFGGYWFWTNRTEEDISGPIWFGSVFIFLGIVMIVYSFASRYQD